MTLREALMYVRDKHGSLTPQTVVVEARMNRTTAGRVLHARLEWDNRTAGEQWRYEQARELIRSVRVRYREATEMEAARDVRGFHAVPTPSGHVYEPVEAVLEDDFMRKVVLRSMEREWKALHRRYAHFEEFLEMVRGDVDKAA